MINLFVEGSLISAKALLCLRALFGATWIHSYTRMAWCQHCLVHYGLNNSATNYHLMSPDNRAHQIFYLR